MALWWLLFAPRARSSAGAPLVCGASTRSPISIYVARPRRIDGRYPYPFIDVELGWLRRAQCRWDRLGFILAARTGVDRQLASLGSSAEALSGPE